MEDGLVLTMVMGTCSFIGTRVIVSLWDNDKSRIGEITNIASLPKIFHFQPNSCVFFHNGGKNIIDQNIKQIAMGDGFNNPPTTPINNNSENINQLINLVTRFNIISFATSTQIILSNNRSSYYQNTNNNGLKFNSVKKRRSQRVSCNTSRSDRTENQLDYT